MDLRFSRKIAYFLRKIFRIENEGGDKQCGKADASFFPHRQRGEAERVSKGMFGGKLEEHPHLLIISNV